MKTQINFNITKNQALIQIYKNSYKIRTASILHAIWILNNSTHFAMLADANHETINIFNSTLMLAYLIEQSLGLATLTHSKEKYYAIL